MGTGDTWGVRGGTGDMVAGCGHVPPKISVLTAGHGAAARPD